MDPPNYASEEFADLRQALSLALNLTDQEAAAHLTTTWRQRNPQPDHQVEPPPPPAPNQLPPQPHDAAHPPVVPAQVDKKTMPKIRRGEPIPTTRIPDPSEHALRKLRNFEYVELWYFTPKGRETTAAHALSLNSDTFTISKEDSELMLLPSRASSTPKNIIIQDEDLSFNEMLIAKNVFIAHLAKCNWSEEIIRSFMDFFLLLDTHEIRGLPQGDQAILIYQAEARREWHRALINDRDREAFDISVINEMRLRSIADSIRISLHNRLINVSPSLHSKTKTSTNPSLFSSFHHAHLFPPLLGLTSTAPKMSPPFSLPGPKTVPFSPAPHTSPHFHSRTSPTPLRPRPYMTDSSATIPATTAPPNLHRTRTLSASEAPPPPSLTIKTKSHAKRGPFAPPPILQPLTSAQFAPPVSAVTPTMLPTASLPTHGMETPPIDALAPPKATSETQTVSSSAQIGKNQEAATTSALHMSPNISAQVVEAKTTELRNALERRRLKALTPYHAGEWARLLEASNLMTRYPDLVNMFHNGFHAGIPAITFTYTPRNNASLNEHHSDFINMVNLEMTKDRYIGPASKAQLEEVLGPFQTSPLSIIPKPNKPGKFRLIQNFSHPHYPTSGISSINSNIISDHYPCTWGTFSTIALIIDRLPPGSEGATRDVKEAYRTIPLHPSHWPGMVVKLHDQDSYAIDTQNAFGLASGGGIYGRVADAGAEIMRAQGLGPISKWVDDHLFIRIRLTHLNEFNQLRDQYATTIQSNGGQRHSRGRLWFQGAPLDNGRSEEYDEDQSFPIQDLSKTSLRSPHDALFTYAFQDINDVSAQLGIPWETGKDVPFSSAITFIGLTWDLNTHTVSLPDTKKQKYLASIRTWQNTRTHTLNEAEKLHGRLLHATLVLTRGRPYLINLEAFLGIFHDSPFKPRTPPKHLTADLDWWTSALSSPNVVRPIRTSAIVTDLHAFSDASSEVGIGIVIGNRWRAWRLVPGWNTPGTGRDIGWAEAVGFYFLAATIANQRPPGGHYRLFGDNIGVVEGWWKGRSRNRPTNDIFKMVAKLSDTTDTSFYTRYVSTDLNPADHPSRGFYGPHALLLPPPPIPDSLSTLVVNFDHPILTIEREMARKGVTPKPKPKPPRDPLRINLNYDLDYQAQELAAQATSWR